MLSSCPADVLEDYAKQLKNRAVWLATEEQREYKVRRWGRAAAPGSCDRGLLGSCLGATEGSARLTCRDTC